MIFYKQKIKLFKSKDTWKNSMLYIPEIVSEKEKRQLRPILSHSYYHHLVA